MNQTSDSISSMNSTMNGPSGSTGVANADGTVRRVAQKAHEAVDKLEQTFDSGTEKVMNWQQEYGEMAREQVRNNPLTVVVSAFAIGFLFAKLMR